MTLGVLSALLLVGALNGLGLAVLLLRARPNRLANRLLAALLVLIAIRLVPYILGYAGAYELYPWLTFAPFDFSLAYGPLLLAYVVALTTQELPRRWWLHVVLPAAQALYYLVCFSLPISRKWAWYTGAHLSLIEPLGLMVAFMSLAFYLCVSWRELRRYHLWLQTTYSDIERWRLTWIYQLIGATAFLLVVSCTFAVTHWFVAPVNYFERFPLMIAFALLAYVLGGLGWRYSGTVYPDRRAVRLPAPTSPEEPAKYVDDARELDVASGPESNYSAIAREWSLRVYAAGWWRDSELTLASLASHLHASPRTVSRVLGEGAQQSFYEFVNRMRVRGVTESLAAESRSRDLLSLALESGFSSKASFNRAFRAYTGMSPSAYREQLDASATRDGESARKLHIPGT